MGKKEETKFKERIQPKLRALPRTWCKKIQLVGLRGVPDFLLCVNGVFVAIELKVDSPLEELQKWNLEEIRKAGGVGLVVTPDNWDLAYDFLKTLALEGLEEAKKVMH